MRTELQQQVTKFDLSLTFDIKAKAVNLAAILKHADEFFGPLASHFDETDVWIRRNWQTMKDHGYQCSDSPTPRCAVEFAHPVLRNLDTTNCVGHYSLSEFTFKCLFTSRCWNFAQSGGWGIKSVLADGNFPGWDVSQLSKYDQRLNAAIAEIVAYTPASTDCESFRLGLIASQNWKQFPNLSTLFHLVWPQFFPVHYDKHKDGYSQSAGMRRLLNAIASKLDLKLNGLDLSQDYSAYSAVYRLLLAVYDQYLQNHPERTPPHFDYLTQLLAAREEADAEELLLMKQALVLYGVPGTSKTHYAEVELLPAVADSNNHVKKIQFHSGYSYADLMIGIRPESDPANKATLTYPVKPGILYRLAAEAANALTNYGDDRFGDGTRVLHPESNPETDDEVFVDERKPIRYALLIDEINRADLARVFGEVMYCIEYRGKKIQLPHVLPNGTVGVESALTPGKMIADPFDCGRNFYLPKNLYIVGTMNQADRSIGAFDAALRRRFAWYPMNFSPVRLHAMLLGNGIDPKAIEAFVSLASRLNAMVAVGTITAPNGTLKLPLSAEHTIGHTYFAEVRKIMKSSGQSQSSITPLHRERLWLYSIGPLLEDALGYEAPVHAKALNELKDLFIGKQS
jgi:hypothetical protein